MVNGDCPDYLKSEIEQVRREEGVQTKSKGNIHIKKCTIREGQKKCCYMMGLKCTTIYLMK